MDNKAFCKATQSSVFMLPDELLTNILGNLPFRCKAMCHVVNKRLNTLLGCPASDLIWNSCDLCDFMPICRSFTSCQASLPMTPVCR